VNPVPPKTGVTDPGYRTPGGPYTSGMAATRLQVLQAEVTDCRRCPRLVAWREEVARTKRAAYRDEEYWGRPIPGFGDPAAHLLVFGLAPAAHGGNRTGRVFTGDRSGDFLFAALHRAGFANRPASLHRGDGLKLRGCYISAAVRCAPPANKPTPEERDACQDWWLGEVRLLKRLSVIVCLGSFAWDTALRGLRRLNHPVGRPPFGHAAEAVVGPFTLLGCYHPSQQNTFTGRLTAPMLDAVFARANVLVAGKAGCT
jgi:uracil-DNA glycosylase